MATEITMPKLSDTMTEGRLIAWRKSVGERVERGEIIAEVETDKANMELEAFAAGVLLETRVKPGELVPVGTVIGRIGEPGEEGTPPPAGEAKPLPPEEPAVSAKGPAETPPEAGEVPERIMEQPTEELATQLAEVHVGTEKASPLVRRLARERGIDLSLVEGSGPDGRILREDLERFQAQRVEVNVSAGEETVGGEPVAEGGVQPLSRMRAAIARTVTEAWRTIPHFSVTVAVDMAEAEEVRRELKEAGSAVSHNDLIVKAAAMALAKFPLVNASFGERGIVHHGEVNIGIAVSLEDGLLVPVIRGCQRLSLKEIAGAGGELIERARSGRISEKEISGGTFSISNLGMFGVEEFVAVIHPPQGAILAVGAVLDTPVIRNGQLAAGRIMRMTLSADHRLLDGAYAARFLDEVKHILEKPVTMLV